MRCQDRHQAYLVCSTATTSHQVESINDFIAEECGKHPEFYGFGTLHPDYADLEGETNRIIRLGLHGIKLHPDFQRFDIDSPGAYKIYEQIAGRLPVLIHMGDDRYAYSKPERLARVMQDFPTLRVMASHLADTAAGRRHGSVCGAMPISALTPAAPCRCWILHMPGSS